MTRSSAWGAQRISGQRYPVVDAPDARYRQQQGPHDVQPRRAQGQCGALLHQQADNFGADGGKGGECTQKTGNRPGTQLVGTLQIAAKTQLLSFARSEPIQPQTAARTCESG